MQHTSIKTTPVFVVVRLALLYSANVQFFASDGNDFGKV